MEGRRAGACHFRHHQAVRACDRAQCSWDVFPGDHPRSRVASGAIRLSRKEAAGAFVPAIAPPGLEPGLSRSRVGTAGAAVPAKLPGTGHLPTIGARFPAPKCPVLPGETEAETVAVTTWSLARSRPWLYARGTPV